MVLAPDHYNPEIFNIAWELKYEPTIPNDQNRAHDGIDLRARYVRESSNGLPPIGQCTMLEFLIALAIRLNEADYDPAIPNRVGPWFWTLIDNMDVAETNAFEIREAMIRVNERTYSFDGWGGLFPLKSPPEDQRETEVWYQMQSYLMENLY